jgi:hypothetical protein
MEALGLTIADFDQAATLYWNVRSEMLDALGKLGRDPGWIAFDEVVQVELVIWHVVFPALSQQRFEPGCATADPGGAAFFRTVIQARDHASPG